MRSEILQLVVVLATCVGAARIAHADEAPQPGASDATGAPAFTVDVDSDAEGVLADREAIAAELASELGAEVRLTVAERPSRAAITIRYRAASRSLTVRASHEGGRVVERTVPAEADPKAVRREAILLAGNLARDEARELLDALAARARTARPVPARASSPTEASPAAAPPVPKAPPRDDGEVPITFGLVYPIATNFGRPNVRTWFDLSLGYGRVGRVDGVQLAAAVGHSSEQVRGVQIAGALGLTRSLRGVAIAPVNIADDVEGVQLGVVNVARRVKGAQLGVINVAEDVDGAALGVVTVNRHGVKPIAWASTLSYANAGIKFASKYAYTILAMTWGSPETDVDPRFGTVGALGVHLPLIEGPSGAPGLDVEAEGAISNQQPQGFAAEKSNTWVHPRVLVGYGFARHFRLFAGGGARFAIDVDVGKPAPRPEILGGVEF